MKTTIKYIVLTAVRDWLFVGLLALLGVIYALSFLYGGASLVEEKEAALVFTAGASRLLLVTGLIIFTCFHLHRGFETKEIETILTKPISRLSFILAYWFGLSVVAAVLVTACFALLFMVSFNVSQGMLLWIISLFLECLIATSISLAVSLIMKSAVASVLGSMCFYVMARMSGFFVATIDFGQGGLSNIFAKTGAMVVKLVSVFIPRLDQFGLSQWLVYSENLGIQAQFVLMQSIIYIPLLIGVAYFDFRRREF